jgi:hypothetical protein
MRRRQENQRERGRDDIIQLSVAYTTVADNSRAMALASRCESRLTRMYQSSYKILRELQAARAKQSTEPAAPEPTQPEPPPPIAAEAAKTQPAKKIFDIKPRAAKVVGQAGSLPADADMKAGGAGASPARNREGEASL